MTLLSVVIITYNEENNIERCIRSVLDIADEIVVLDSFSTDNTREICEKYKVRFYQHLFSGYIEQKNKANEFAKYPHIFSIDADEEVSEKLKQSILAVKKNWKADAYYMRRLTNYCGQWIKHTDWYPDQKIRMWDSGKGQWDGLLIHEKVKMQENAKSIILDGNLLHYSFPSIDHHLEVVNKFTSIMAEENFKKKKKAGLGKIIFSPFWKFIKSYIVRLGFLDGYYGFIIGIISAYATFLKYVKIKELYKNQGTIG